MSPLPSAMPPVATALRSDMGSRCRFDPAISLVSSAQMQRLEEQIFSAGMPVAALMEKVGLAVFAQLQRDFPQAQRIGILCGTGHNGGDGLVVGRELWLAQKSVKVWLGKPDLKPLTAGLFLHLQRSAAARYSFLLGIPALFLAGVEELISEFRAEALLSQGLGTLSAFVFSYLSIDWLIQFLQRSSTWLFIVYRIGFGLFIILGLALGFLRP